MDMELLNEHFTALARGEEVSDPPLSSSARQMRDDQPVHAAAA